MIDERLPDWAFTEEELDEMAINLLTEQNLTMPGHLVIYSLHKDGENTGIVMLLATQCISDTLHAITRMWAPYNMHAEVEGFTEEKDPAAAYKLNALQLVLDKYRYRGKIHCAGSDKLYRYKGWFKELIGTMH